MSLKTSRLVWLVSRHNATTQTSCSSSFSWRSPYTYAANSTTTTHTIPIIYRLSTTQNVDWRIRGTCGACAGCCGLAAAEVITGFLTAGLEMDALAGFTAEDDVVV